MSRVSHRTIGETRNSKQSIKKWKLPVLLFVYLITISGFTIFVVGILANKQADWGTIMNDVEELFWKDSVRRNDNAFLKQGQSRKYSTHQDCPSLLVSPELAIRRNVIVVNNNTINLSSTNKPRMIIHIGPSKTGTTSLQQDSVKLFRPLALDHYVYIGRYAPPSIRQKTKINELFRLDKCFEQVRQLYLSNKNSQQLQGKTALLLDIPCWKERMRGLDELRRANQSIIISDEKYSYEPDLLKSCNDPSIYGTIQFALQDEWDITVVATYRRYSEWLVSVVKEMNDKECLHPTKAAWPQDGGKRCLETWDYMPQWIRRNDAGANFYRNLDNTIPAWNAAGVDVKVLNFHLPKHITSTFYCDIVPDTPNTCQYTQSKALATIHNKKSVMSAVYSQIAFAAAKKGIFTNFQQSRYNVTKQLETYGNSLGLTMANFPILCPPREALEMLLKKSLAFERAVLFEFFNETLQTENKNDHAATTTASATSSFWFQVYNRKEFCFVDTDALLYEITSWPALLQELQDRSILELPTVSNANTTE